MTAATARYYADFAKRHGFADSKLRGHGYDLVRISPAAPFESGASPFTYCASAKKPVHRGTQRDRVLDRSISMHVRERQIGEKLTSLHSLVDHVSLRIESRTGAAAREALDDARVLISGGVPLAGSDRLEVLNTLVRVLSRYA